MNYGRLFITAWQITWQHKFLWLFGFLAGMNAIGSSLMRLTFGPGLLSQISAIDPNQLFNNPDTFYLEIDKLLQTVAPWLVSGIVILTVLSLVAWLIVLLAQGAIIHSAAVYNTRPLTFGYTLRQSWSLLARFIAIDTLVYFPVFLILLIIMLVFSGTLIGTIFSAARQDASLTHLLTPLLIGLLCILPLMCISVPAGIITAAFRALAFRDIVIFNEGVRQTMRHTWHILKSNIGNFLILGVLLWGLHYLLVWGLYFVTLPVYTLTAAPGIIAIVRDSEPASWSIIVVQVISALLELISLSIKAVAYTFSAVVWTLAYKEIGNRPFAEDSN